MFSYIDICVRLKHLCRLGLIGAMCLGLHQGVWAQGLVLDAHDKHGHQESMQSLGNSLQVGDVVFIRLSNPLFKKVADVTQSWTNHVGVVIDVSGQEPLIGESRFPFAAITPLSKFIARSENERVAVKRLDITLSVVQKNKIKEAAEQRTGLFYDLGFDLNSAHREFCSRYVYEVVKQATGVSVGQIETFRTLLTRNPSTQLGFWKIWYLGHIPWLRKTITPASILQNTHLSFIFDGYIENK